jgi:ribosomal protein S18 acetylase RimI-like enzyme
VTRSSAWAASSATEAASQVTDIAIMPEHQGRGLGKMIMAALTDYIENQLPKTAYVSLIADGPANYLYRQFGFVETTPRSVGMARNVATK